MTLLIRVLSTVAFIGLSYNVSASAQLNGMAVHNQLSEDQFIAAVYSETLTDDARSLILADEDKVMELRVLADTLYARRFKRMWIEGIAINAGTIDLEKHAQHLADFSNLLKVNLAAGDALRIERETNSGTVLTLNGITLGRIDDDRFFDLLLRTWVGPVPLSSQFKQNLLAAGNVPNDIQQRFSRIKPTEARIEAISEVLDGITADDAVAGKAKDTTTANTAADLSQVTATSATPPPEVAKDAPAEANIAKPTKVQEKTGLQSEESLFSEEDLFADEEEDFNFTAEGVLVEQVYISKLTKWTSSFVSYPRAALKSNKQGTVRLTVTIRRNGKLKDVRFLEKSEHEELNRAAAKAVRSASPYPAVPDAIKGDSFIFTVPVVFLLQ